MELLLPVESARAANDSFMTPLRPKAPKDRTGKLACPRQRIHLLAGNINRRIRKAEAI